MLLRKPFILLFVCALLSAQGVYALSESGREKVEVVALKNNLVYDAAATPNLQLEIRLAPKWSLELGAGFNPFPLKDTQFPKWRHVSAWIAPRYWFCNVFHRDFISVNVAYAHYNVAGGAYPIGWMYNQVKNNRYQGDAVMAGASYGWHFAISPHFSIELEAGVDAGYSWYDRFECKHCGDKTESGGRWLVLPKLGVNLVVPLGGDEQSLARRCDCEKMDSKPEEEMPEQTVQEEPVQEPMQEEPVAPKRPAKQRKGYIEEQPIEVAAIQEPAPRAPRAPQNAYLKARPRRQYYAPEAFFYFDVDVKTLDSAFIRNDHTMRTIDRMLRDTSLHVTAVEVTGYASFDGSVRHNERLAGSRAQMIKEYLQRTYGLDDSLFVLTNAGEQWDEMEMRIFTMDFEGREEVLFIIETEPNFDRRERMIKKLHDGETYRYMRDELKPIMRKLGKVTVYCNAIENQQTK
jgi:outer membrane protein OmpA-like peptidoglycan-associated protein